VRENRTHGSEGGEINPLPDPYRAEVEIGVYGWILARCCLLRLTRPLFDRIKILDTVRCRHYIPKIEYTVWCFPEKPIAISYVGI
jgi:hypothetical protein